MGLKCSPDIAQAIMENVLSDIEDADIKLMMLALSPMIGITTPICYPPFYMTAEKMTLPLTHSNVNWPSKNLTGLVIGLHHKV